MKKWLVLVAWATACGAARAEDRAEVERTPIIGNRELPKVLYIVPWKKPRPTALSARPPGSVLDEPPRALEREVFRRELRYQAPIDPPTRTPAQGDVR